MISRIVAPASESPIEAALRLQNARLAALHTVSLSLTGTLDLDRVLTRVVEMAQVLSESAHSHIFLYDPAYESLTLAASHWSEQARRIPLEPRPGGVTAIVAHTGEPQFISDTMAHAAYAGVPADRKPGAVACLPLIKDSHVLGTLNLGYWQPHAFDPDTRNFLDLLAQHAALAIDNARLHALEVENARMEQELEMARQVQRSLLPRVLPQCCGWEFAALWQPARIVGGDMYDFIRLAPEEDDGAFGICIADVADKGMPAALFMVLTRATLRANATLRCCPRDCVTFTNRILSQDAADGMFVSMVYAQLDGASGALTYVNAGHPLPFWYRHARSQLVELESTGIAMGIEAAAEFYERTLHMEPGDFIFFYTDGVTDAANGRLDAFGKPRLEQLLLDRRRAPAQSMVETLNDALNAHVGRAPQFDDITAVVIKRT